MKLDLHENCDSDNQNLVNMKLNRNLTRTRNIFN